MKYTKGRWHRSGGRGLNIVDDSRMIIVAKIYSSSTHLGPKNKTEYEANACLVAAAPEMYEALISVLDGLDSGLTYDTIDLLNKALEKANGTL